MTLFEIGLCDENEYPCLVLGYVKTREEAEEVCKHFVRNAEGYIVYNRWTYNNYYIDEISTSPAAELIQELHNYAVTELTDTINELKEVKQVLDENDWSLIGNKYPLYSHRNGEVEFYTSHHTRTFFYDQNNYDIEEDIARLEKTLADIQASTKS